MRIYTMGVYGYTEETFRRVLAGIDLDIFVDTRRKRGVRGSHYAFANSKRLQAMLADLGIPYIHRLDLAPTTAMIRAQDAADHETHIARRARTSLTSAFQQDYQREVLDRLDSRAFIDSLGDDIESLLIFCIEGVPEACHRSLLAERLQHDLGGKTMHLVPDIDSEQGAI